MPQVSFQQDTLAELRAWNWHKTCTTSYRPEACGWCWQVSIRRYLLSAVCPCDAALGRMLTSRSGHEGKSKAGKDGWFPQFADR